MFLGLKVGCLVGFLPYDLGSLGGVSDSQSFSFLICNVGIGNSSPGLRAEWGHVQVQPSGPSTEPCLSWPLILRTQRRCPFLELSWVCLLRVTTFHLLRVPVFCDYFAVCHFGYPSAHRGRGSISPTLSLLLEWGY